MTHPAIQADHVAVVTGAASGIGRAAAHRFAAAGMHVVLADIAGDALDAVRSELGGAATAVPTDVRDRDAVTRLKAEADALGPVTAVMSNAGREGGGDLFAGEPVWRTTIETNLWGAIHMIQVFVPDMIAADRPGLVVTTGSKQGITLPPGDTAYNVSKAGLKALTESLSHDLVQATGDRVTAHLLIPGFTFTGFTEAKGVTSKPDAAWTADQVADVMMDHLNRGDFYILCPDNEVDRETDRKRMAWQFSDILDNRPALSRWHPDHKAAFAAYMDDPSADPGLTGRG